jgi:hypothetical protein
VLNSGDVWPACGTVKGVSEGNGVGDEDLGEDEVRAHGLLGNEGVSEQDILRKSPFVTGVAWPDVVAFLRGRRSVSEAARKSKFVVPRALVDPDRAEQTIATLCWSIYSLYQNKQTLCHAICALISRCKADYERYDIFCYFDSKLSDTRASILLH